MQKKYYTMYNVGKAKYLINYFDGESFYPDGSEFYGVKIFSNKREFERELRRMEKEGYKPRGFGE